MLMCPKCKALLPNGSRGCNKCGITFKRPSQPVNSSANISHTATRVANQTLKTAQSVAKSTSGAARAAKQTIDVTHAQIRSVNSAVRDNRIPTKAVVPKKKRRTWIIPVVALFTVMLGLGIFLIARSFDGGNADYISEPSNLDNKQITAEIPANTITEDTPIDGDASAANESLDKVAEEVILVEGDIAELIGADEDGVASFLGDSDFKLSDTHSYVDQGIRIAYWLEQVSEVTAFGESKAKVCDIKIGDSIEEAEAILESVSTPMPAGLAEHPTSYLLTVNEYECRLNIGISAENNEVISLKLFIVPTELLGVGG